MSDMSADFLEFDDRLAFVDAAATVARCDAGLIASTDLLPIFQSRALREEALSIAALDGFAVRRDLFVRLVGHEESTNVDRAARHAADCHNALKAALRLDLSVLLAEQMVELFHQADQSSGRRIRADVQWSIEDDAEWIAAQIAVFIQEANPWTAMETLRSIWTSNRFIGTSRRMALIIAPLILARGFDSKTPVLGMARRLKGSPDQVRDAAASKDRWAHLAAVELASAMRQNIDDLGHLRGLRTTLRTLCPSGRSSSSIEAAIDYLLETPVFSAKRFASELGLTARGAKVVLDKLEEASIVEIEGGLRNRLFTCPRSMS